MAKVGRADVNRSAVLAFLGSQGPASRAEIARALAMSPALVTQLMKPLLAEGLVEEGEIAPSEGGRPGRRLRLAGRGGSAVGVKVAANHLTCVEVGLDGSVRRSESVEFDPAAPSALQRVSDALRDFGAVVTHEGVLGVGVAVPGAVGDQSDGSVDAPTLGWHGVPLGALLRAELGLPVIVENDVNALAVAERLYGFGSRYDDFLVVTIGRGIGAASVQQGLLHRGHHGAAGELGHVVVPGPDGRMTSAGLETFIGAPALLARAAEVGALEVGAGLAELNAAAVHGDPQVIQILAEAGRLLGVAVAGAVHLLDPAAVIVSGEGTTAWGAWADAFDASLRDALMPSRRGLPVHVETWQDEAWARGAAALVLATPFDSAGVAGHQGQRVRERLQDAAQR